MTEIIKWKLEMQQAPVQGVAHTTTITAHNVTQHIQTGGTGSASIQAAPEVPSEEVPTSSVTHSP